MMMMVANILLPQENQLIHSGLSYYHSILFTAIVDNAKNSMMLFYKFSLLFLEYGIDQYFLLLCPHKFILGVLYTGHPIISN